MATPSSGLIPNLVNGISQQPHKLRLPSQAQASDNFYPSVVDGLVPRAPTEHLARLRDALPAGTFSHFIFRDDNEEYLMALFPDATIKVWDINGDEKTVNIIGDAADYISGLSNPEDTVRALTVADYTFIVNTTKVVAAGTEESATRPFEALVHVLAGNYGKHYRIFINGELQAGYRTPDGSNASHSPYIDTNYIADTLRRLLDAGEASTEDPGLQSGNGAINTVGGLAVDDGGDGGGYNTAPWSLGRYHSTIYIRNTDVDFTISVEDGYGGRAMKEIKSVVQKFSDLPIYAPSGYVCKVAGSDIDFDEYYVRFEKLDDEDGMGVWKETLAPGTRLGLDETTMPHVLIREANGTFTFKPADWVNRQCGDLDSNPDPSFVGQTIQDVFFHRNRLGFLTVENYVLSQAADFFNFYRTSVITLVDGDPIDGAASHIKVSLLRHAVPFNDVLLLFSDETQFRLAGNDLLTPKTVNAKPLSEIRADPRIRPTVVGSRLYFVTTATDWTQVTEYVIDKSTESANDEDISAHAPAYIPGGIRFVVSSKERSLIAFYSEGDPSRIYIYKHFWNGNERLQSAWSRWTLPGVTAIKAMHFKHGVLYLAVEREDGLYIEKLTIRHGSHDQGVNHVTHLDRRASLAGTYDAETGRTSFLVPYIIPDGMLCVTPTGEELEITTLGPDTFYVKGEHPHVWVGTLYECEYEFSTFFRRDAEAKVNESAGRLQIMHLLVDYGKTNAFEVEVAVDGRAPKIHSFDALMVNDPSTTLNTLNLKSGKFTVPVMSRNDRVRIKLKSKRWLPCSFSSARWIGTWSRTTLER